MSSKRDFFNGHVEAYSALVDRGHAWMVMEATIESADDFSENDLLIVASFEHEGESYQYRSSEGRSHTLMENGLQKISLNYLTPEVRSPEDVFKTYLWYRGKDSVAVRSFTVEQFSPR